jgi:hypothetical protein
MVMNTIDKTYLPFNNQIETGIRVLTLLDKWFPVELDITTLLYLDYVLVHSGDINEDKPSLHVSVPYRRGELLVRKPVIQSGINLLVAKGLAEIVYLSSGIHYKASEGSTPFIDALSTEYTASLIDRAAWAYQNFRDFSSNEIHTRLSVNRSNQIDSFNLEILD